MTPDVNVLLAASRTDHPHHGVASAWLERAVTTAEGGGSLLVLPMVPFAGAPDVAALGAKELALLGYLAFAATIGGFAVWSWLLRHLPASTAGLTIFLNPPLTLVSKIALAALLPATFVVAISPQEWAGGAVMLAGVAFAVWPRRSTA